MKPRSSLLAVLVAIVLMFLIAPSGAEADCKAVGFVGAAVFLESAGEIHATLCPTMPSPSPAPRNSVAGGVTVAPSSTGGFSSFAALAVSTGELHFSELERLLFREDRFQVRLLALDHDELALALEERDQHGFDRSAIGGNITPPGSSCTEPASSDGAITPACRTAHAADGTCHSAPALANQIVLGHDECIHVKEFHNIFQAFRETPAHLRAAQVAARLAMGKG